MRKSLALALMIASLPNWAAAKGIPVGVYEVLESHPACSGLGKIAYRVTFDTEIFRTDYFRSIESAEEAIPPSCEIKMIKGGERTSVPIPCPKPGDPDYAERILTESKSMDNFCAATEQISKPVVRLKGELTGCVSIEGHKFIAGSWEATSPETLGSAPITGDYRSPSLIAVYLPPKQDIPDASAVSGPTSTEFYDGAVHIRNTTVLPARIFVSLRFNGLSLPKVAEGPVGVAGSVEINLVEKSNSACLSDIEKCFWKQYEVTSVLEPPTAGTSLLCIRAGTISDNFRRAIMGNFGPLDQSYLIRPKGYLE